MMGVYVSTLAVVVGVNNMEPIKYNMGSGPKKIEGYIHVDGLEWKGVTDIVHDLTDVPYKFVEINSVDEIICVEVLEHIDFKKVLKVLIEWKRILKPGGKLLIQVPDCGKAMEYYVNKQICDCVPHKPKTPEDVKADPECFQCGGRGKIHPNRWLFAFTGAGKHEYDFHLNIFTKDRMIELLHQASFNNFEFKEDPKGWKLIVEIYK